MTRVRVSVLIPNWNGGERLAACVASFRRELAASLSEAKGEGWEIVVADDASPQGEADLARLREAFPEDVAAGRLVLFRRPANGGFGATVNEAASRSKGAFLLLANNDLIAQRGLVEELLRPFGMPGSERIAAVSARTEALDGSANHVAVSAERTGGRVQTRWEDPPPLAQAPREADEFPRTDFFQGGSALLRREAWDEAGGFDQAFSPGYWEDYDMAARLAAKGWLTVYSPRARAFHVGKASMSEKHSPGGARDLAEAHRLLWESRHGAPGLRARIGRALAVAGEVGRECLRGGPFHAAKGLRIAWRKRRSLG